MIVLDATFTAEVQAVVRYQCAPLLDRQLMGLVMKWRSVCAMRAPTYELATYYRTMPVVHNINCQCHP